VLVVISLISIDLGLVVSFGLLAGKRLNGWTALFLATTATSVSRFGFPFDHLLPSRKVGIISLVVLGVAILARYWFHLAGAWRWIYVVCTVLALYLNVLVLIVQLFQKVQALKVLAPKGWSHHFCSRSLSFWCFSSLLALSRPQVPQRASSYGSDRSISLSPSREERKSIGDCRRHYTDRGFDFHQPQPMGEFYAPDQH
jgi:hypothetical protein